MPQIEQVEAGALFEYVWRNGRDSMLLVSTGRGWNEWQIVAVMPETCGNFLSATITPETCGNFLSTTITPVGWTRRVRVFSEELPLYMGWVKGELFERIIKGEYKRFEQRLFWNSI